MKKMIDLYKEGLRKNYEIRYGEGDLLMYTSKIEKFILSKVPELRNYTYVVGAKKKEDGKIKFTLEVYVELGKGVSRDNGELSILYFDIVIDLSNNTEGYYLTLTDKPTHDSGEIPMFIQKGTIEERMDVLKEMQNILKLDNELLVEYIRMMNDLATHIKSSEEDTTTEYQEIVRKMWGIELDGKEVVINFQEYSNLFGTGIIGENAGQIRLELKAGEETSYREEYVEGIKHLGDTYSVYFPKKQVKGRHGNVTVYV